MEGQHAALAFGLAAGQSLLHHANGLGREPVQEPSCLGPRLVGRVPGDHMEADAEADGTALLGGETAYPRNLLRHLGRWFTPRQIDIAVPCGDCARLVGRTTEVHPGHGIGKTAQPGALHPEVPAVQGHRLPRHSARTMWRNSPVRA